MTHFIGPNTSPGLYISVEFCRGGKRINRDQDQGVDLTHGFEHPRLLNPLGLVALVVEVGGRRVSQKTSIAALFIEKLIEDECKRLGKVKFRLLISLITDS